MQKQKGLVLFFSLIVLVLMTVIGVALAVNSGQSLRMAGAGSERVEAKAAADGGQTRAIATAGDMMTKMTVKTNLPIMKIGINTVQNTFTPLAVGDVGCQRKPKANSPRTISCRRIEVESLVKFGRNDMGELTVVAGVEQEVMGGS